MPTIPFPPPEISNLLIALKENAHDPITFSNLRAKILALHFELSNKADLEKLQDKQAEIEAMIAVTGFNQTSVDLLLEELTTCADLLVSATRSLKNC